MDCKTINLQNGSKGEDVQDLQNLLQDRGYYAGKLDGVYGNLTMNSVVTLQKKQGNTPDGVFGTKTCTALRKTSIDISNSTRLLTLDTFKDMKSRTDTWIKANAKTPLIVYITSEHFEYISFNKYSDVLNRYNNWVKTKGVEPTGCYINTPTSKDTTNSMGYVVGRLEKASGKKITDYLSLYNAFKKFYYGYYYDDRYPQNVALDRLDTGKYLNCTDFAQLYYWACKELNITVEILRGQVKCNSGKWFGHVFCRVQINGKWIYADPSAAARYEYNIGNFICTKGYTVTNVNPGWAISDDGKT